MLEAYAKLWGRIIDPNDDTKACDFCAFVEKLPCKLGRPSLNNDPPDIALDHKSLSRHHATIRQHGQTRLLEILVHGKNGVMLNGEHVAKDTAKVLQSGDALKLGPYCVYFLYARLE